LACHPFSLSEQSRVLLSNSHNSLPFSLAKSSTIFCFFIRDRLADSLFDTILFLFFSSIDAHFASISDPELVTACVVDIFSSPQSSA
jgi:hypothetical protein